jgi:hypothetical protein
LKISRCKGCLTTFYYSILYTVKTLTFYIYIWIFLWSQPKFHMPNVLFSLIWHSSFKGLHTFCRKNLDSYTCLRSHFVKGIIIACSNSWPPLCSSRSSTSWHTMQCAYLCPLFVHPLCQLKVVTGYNSLFFSIKTHSHWLCIMSLLVLMVLLYVSTYEAIINS